LLNTGGRMWTKNDHAYQKQHQLQNVYQVLAKDLQSAYCSEFLPEAALQGDEREMAFWRETPTGLQKITYRYDPTQKVLYRAAGFWGEKLEETPLFQDILTWKFEYFEEQSRNWKYNWDAQIKTAVPSLVKVTATTGLTNLGSLVIPLEIGPKEEND
ncbi:MAG TPA: hypothetical protein VEC37_13520, partial [Bacillota bacterium]|nr:hypothetical protein [Bacillota bacterium]